MSRATMLPKIRSNRGFIASPAVGLRRLRAWAPPALLRLLRQLQEAGGHPVLVGGAVRDSLRGVRPKDWDIAVDLPIETVVRKFRRVVRSGEQHGTVMVLMDGFGMEVTTLRGTPDGDPAARLRDDLLHRDFTFNAMAADLLGERWHDPAGGHADLVAGKLRFVGSAAERLTEDPLRALRAARFVAVLGLQLQRSDKPALLAALPGLAATAWERRREEMLRLLAGANRCDGLQLLLETGLLQALAPELQNTRPATLQRLQALPPDALTVFAAWAWEQGCSGAGAAAILTRWRASKAQCARAERWIDGARQPPEAGRGAALRRWVLAVGPGEAPGAAALLEARWPQRYAGLARATRRVCQRSCVNLSRLRIDGHALRALGVVPREVGPTLQRLLEAVVEVPARNRPATLLRLAAPQTAR